jgi:RNA polymerase sigma-70 factor (ECF subfamily)
MHPIQHISTQSHRQVIEEAKLIEQLEQGLENAFRHLVDQHKDVVYNTCLGFLHNPHDAEDVSQEVFIQVFDSIHDFRKEASLSTWIYRISVTKSLELIRYRKRKKRSWFFKALDGMFNEPDQEPDESTYGHPGLALENKERAKVLFSEIDKLTDKQRVAFTLQKIEGMSYQEVAKIMELSIPAVESLIHRAKNTLKKNLYHYYQQNELD